MQEKEDNGFTVLENKNIGRNLSTFRKLRDRKAMEVAEHLGIKEATYTKYERGESKITIDLIQKVAEFLNVDPLQIVTANPGYVIENLTNSPFSINSSNNTNNINDKQTEVMMKMMETMMQMNDSIKRILEERK
ncbi:DNA-binding protein [Rhodonellum psychrophilum GCM71 = DSM 17998]|uniref:DNA-binding protein n=2 Tax=Rhodonellum TaxID=336827 RepID=U5BSW3_9BACT|nr:MULTISPECIES: helix-turn-helix transcriptional regulator [Rhodonellum]ERM80619.1 DNA-binding protein [Rhodonellum psychrophilum GCM71 = DSM 17998]SDZ55115.1 Helix-turn-helix [Rhodonellum ikkaensis]